MSKSVISYSFSFTYLILYLTILFRSLYDLVLDIERMELLKRLENLIEFKNKKENGTWKEALPTDVDNDMHLFETVKTIFNEYQLVAQQTIHVMNLPIRTNKENFLKVKIN